MGKVEKEKKKKKKHLFKDVKTAIKVKSKCCKKYKKGENKRCDSCPMFDLKK
jgi:hypothetical protein